VQTGSCLHIAKCKEISREKQIFQFGCVRAITGTQLMDTVSVIAASGLQSRMQALDLVANNLANSTTGGFKLDQEFYSLFTADEGDSADPATTRLPLIEKQWTNFSQGVLTPTGNPLDLAISGAGFFTVQGPTGPLYTRNGSFQLSTNGQLITSEGYAVLGDGGQPIQTNSPAPIEVDAKGTVTQSGQQIGQMQVADFPNRSILSKVGNSYFTAGKSNITPAPSPNAILVQGKIENSNVAPADSTVRLVALMRQFEMLQKAITVTTDMNKQALAEVARVSGA
jgi:flagellar basal-body rod protein FlgF